MVPYANLFNKYQIIKIFCNGLTYDLIKCFHVFASVLRFAGIFIKPKSNELKI